MRTTTNYWALTQAISPKFFIGRAVGYQYTVCNLAGICASLVTGFLVEKSGGSSSAILFAAASLWVAAISHALLVRESCVSEIREIFAEHQALTTEFRG